MANNVTCETLTRKNLRFSHDLKAVSVGGVIMNSYIQESSMNQHRNESSMVQFAYPEDNRNDVNESSFPIISGSFSHAFPMLSHLNVVQKMAQRNHQPRRHVPQLTVQVAPVQHRDFLLETW